MTQHGRTDDAFKSHPGSPQAGLGFETLQVQEPALALLNASNLPRYDLPESIMVADVMTPLTDEGTVISDTTIPSTVQLNVHGPAVFTESVNHTGVSQFAEAGAGFNESGKKRIIFDQTGSFVLRLLTTLAEGIKAVLGDFAVTAGTLTAKSDNTWSGSSTVTAGKNTWVTGGTPWENTLLSTDLPSYDGNFIVSGTLQAHTSTISGSGYESTDARVRVKVSTDGGTTWIDKGTVGAVSDGGGAGHTTSKTFSGTFNIGTGTSIIVRLYAEAYCGNTGELGSTSTGTGTISAVNAVTWKQSGGTTVMRRGLFLGAESGMPHITFEPLLGTDVPTTGLIEGELFYDGTAHKFKFYDGTAIRTVTST